MCKCFILMTHFCKSAFVWGHQRKVAKSSIGVVYVVAEKLIWFAVSFHLQTRGWRGCTVCPHISSLRLGNWPSSGPHRVIRHLIIPLLEARGSEAPWEERRGKEGRSYSQVRPSWLSFAALISSLVFNQTKQVCRETTSYHMRRTTLQPAQPTVHSTRQKK